jgi:hypothetical protein
MIGRMISSGLRLTRSRALCNGSAN